MTETMRDRLIQALDSADRPAPEAAEVLTDLADLVFLTTLLDQLSERANRRLAAWPTVTAHIGHARDHVASVHRTLTHAAEILAFNTAQASPLRTDT
ncbi:hypothetical protein [Pseudonocardia acidicola]|uniref:Uncharacterized protein n=1 Tax=Pseudonocardia acidicola TaxID=2724939 RepID=A0ABX1S7M9_9PSEU|nr:hypothetical protein [Pseudonocardia acidicola]NMH97565.1 hypothetical protein [Pseudonocardia acidicola]